MAGSHTRHNTHTHTATPTDPATALARVGLRNTRPRRLAYEALRTATQPISAEALFLQLKENEPSLSLSTVYRLLDAFAEKGLADRAHTSEDGKALYELASGVHRHHLHCLSCHRITVVEGCPLEAYEKVLEARTHFHVTGHKLELTGYCETCMAQQTENAPPPPKG